MRGWGMCERRASTRPGLPVLDADRFQLALIEIRRVDVEREDVARARAFRDAAVVAGRFEALAIDLEEHGAALDPPVERRAHRLDPGEWHALHLLPPLAPLHRLRFDVPVA